MTRMLVGVGGYPDGEEMAGERRTGRCLYLDMCSVGLVFNGWTSLIEGKRPLNRLAPGKPLHIMPRTSSPPRKRSRQTSLGRQPPGGRGHAAQTAAVPHPMADPDIWEARLQLHTLALAPRIKLWATSWQRLGKPHW